MARMGRRTSAAQVKVVGCRQGAESVFKPGELKAGTVNTMTLCVLGLLLLDSLEKNEGKQDNKNLFSDYVSYLLDYGMTFQCKLA